jgi:hypothetical protein
VCDNFSMQEKTICTETGEQAQMHGVLRLART